MTPRKLIVVAGAGAYPRLIVEGAKAAGVETVDVPISFLAVVYGI